MGRTVSEKIIGRAAGLDDVRAGDIVWARVDKAMLDDILGPRVEIAKDLKALGCDIWDANRVVVISDHYTPPATVKQAEIVKFTRDWSKERGIENYFEYEGPCHQIMAEKGYVLPGEVVLGTDSHTCMGGALGAFATGIGSTEMAGVLATGTLWMRVPETIRVVWDGKLQRGVMAKDISLATIREIGHAGATYKTVEYTGEAIRSMPVDERMAISNMAVEMGAKAGIIPPDEKTFAYLQSIGVQGEGFPCVSDADATFCRTYRFDASALVPMVAVPHAVDRVYAATELEKTTIHQAYIGSCTGGRYSDLTAALQILKGRKVANGVRLLISPASRSIMQRAAEDGTLAGLMEAGAMILAPTCGVCVGVHSGLLAAGENCISSTNRNFIGRMGSPEAGIYLASPYTVAASAVTGYVTDPGTFL